MFENDDVLAILDISQATRGPYADHRQEALQKPLRRRRGARRPTSSRSFRRSPTRSRRPTTRSA
ncbi:MAG: hypothetical protein MZU97_10220 [Bacillus subtilis]|nr:hypothetical protein [Bacillus subtilis]